MATSGWMRPSKFRLPESTDRGQAARDQKANEPRLLVDCIASGDSDGAAELMRAHIDTSLGATAVWRLGHDHS